MGKKKGDHQQSEFKAISSSASIPESRMKEKVPKLSEKYECGLASEK